MSLPGRMAHSGSSRAGRAGAGNLTVIVGCVERRFARQRGYWSARVEKTQYRADERGDKRGAPSRANCTVSTANTREATS